MRAMSIAGLVACLCTALAGCGTASRYEYYDYGGQTVDEKIDEKADRIGRTYKSISPYEGRMGRR